MTTEDIGFAVAALTDGAFVNEFFLDDDKIDMYLYNQQGPNATLETLNNITLQTPVGETLLLSELVTIEETVDTSTLNIIPPRSVTLETGVAKVREEVESRLRPIAISSITTICGLAPIVFLPSAGSELYRGVGVIVMAGIIGATLVTLTMLPALTVMVKTTQAHCRPDGEGVLTPP
jgi:multidrug efflux pump subunit AcrB